MSRFKFETALDDCLGTFNGPLNNGPTPRWQRKASKKRASISSFPLSPCNTHDSRLAPTKTPIRTPKLRSRRGMTPLKTPNTQKRKGKTPLKSPKKTPQRTPANTTPYVDRFIPNRTIMDNDKNYFQLVNEPDLEMMEETNSPEKREKVQYQKTMKDKLETASESRILHFKQKAPTAREGYQNNLRVIYCQNKSSTAKLKINRYIPNDPERILDAPGLLNDFYLNLLDWGSNNCLAISLAGAVYIWNAATCTTTHLLQLSEEEYVSSVAWVQNSNVLAVGCSGGYVQLWDVDQSKCLRAMAGHSGRVGSLSWNLHILSSGCRSGMIHNHDVRVANHLVSELGEHTQDVCGLSWSPDGKFLASGGNDNLVNVWSPLQSGQNPLWHRLTDHMSAIKAVSWCPWQPSVLASGGGTADRKIHFWNATTGTRLNSVDAKSQISSVLWSREYREVITGHGFAQNQLSIWKYPSMTRIADLTGHISRVLCLAMSPCGEYVASAGADETLRIWKCFERDHSKKKSFTSVAKSSNANFSIINKIR